MYKLLVIDNYDSFTYNLVQMFMRYDLDLKVYRHDKISIYDILTNIPDYILISPGPKSPSDAGISKEVIRNFYCKIPILGICLGMQCINEIFGGRTVNSPEPMHGKSSLIYHNEGGLFKGLPSPFYAARYHSLIVKLKLKKVKNILVPDAWSSEGIVMGFSHIKWSIYGLQFHPESFLTDYGFLLVENFLKAGSMKDKL